MSEASISVAEDQFSCSICLDLLKDPVTVLCGHSFCLVCINECWDQEDQKGIYSCPQCRRSFTSRPAVARNTMLADVVEKLKKTRIQAAPPSGPEDVECDLCAGRKRKACSSCLVCLASYCETHLQPHHESPAFKKHKLVKASRRLQEQICPQHEKLLEVYCRSDQQCICMLCMLDEHKGHDPVSAAAERAEKQKELVETQKQYQQQIQKKEQELQLLRKTVDLHKRSAQAAVQDSETIFTELIRCIERKRSEVAQLIRAQEKVAADEAEEILTRLEQEIAELRKRNSELEQLSLTEDHIHFLQSFKTLSGPFGPSGSPTFMASPLLSFENIVTSASQLRAKLEDFWTEEFEKTPDRAKELQMVPVPDPQTREDFQDYSCWLTMDPNTAYKHLCFSERNTVVTCNKHIQPYPHHPDRFDEWRQVLCRESVQGRCYWEVEWTGSGGVDIAVSYISINRKGNGTECLFGSNSHSWRLFCSPSSCSFKHRNIENTIWRGSGYSRVGVYVDHQAGILSFYFVSDKLTLLHRVQTTFTQPLYAGFGLSFGSSVKVSLPAK